MDTLSVLDYVVILIYLAGIAYVGFRVARGQNTTEAYFLAGRRIPGWAVGFSLIGTIISSVSFVALPGTAFTDGWRLMIPNLMVPFILFFVMAVVVPFYRRVIRMSSYEFLEQRFGLFARLYGAASFMVLRVVDLGFTMLLTAVAVEVMTGWNIYGVLLALGLFTLSYTVIGGVEAVIWTDVAQGVILFAGALVILSMVLFLPPGGPWVVLSTAYEGGRFSFGDFSLGAGLTSDRPSGWLLVLAGLIHFGRSYGTEQNMVQRYLVARSDDDARRGVLVGALGSFVVWATFFLIGSCLWAFFRLMEVTLPARGRGPPRRHRAVFHFALPAVRTGRPAARRDLRRRQLLDQRRSQQRVDVRDVRSLRARAARVLGSRATDVRTDLRVRRRPGIDGRRRVSRNAARPRDLRDLRDAIDDSRGRHARPVRARLLRQERDAPRRLHRHRRLHGCSSSGPSSRDRSASISASTSGSTRSRSASSRTPSCSASAT